ncbi:MAG: hypothetical protein M3Q39_13230, partial [Actinomycetota bacterium]|nr:hypothetical protein [Actinomycetota bacterium]
RLSAAEQAEQARGQLRLAAADADQPLSADAPPEWAAVALTMRARQAVRSLAQEFDPPPGDLPVWAAADIPESHVDLVNAYAAAEGWPSQQTALDEQREILTSPSFRTTLQALAGLYPTNPVPGQLLALLDEIDEAGIDAVFTRRMADYNRRAVLAAWIDTPTWTESEQFLREHRASLTDEESIDILAGAADDTARQHLAILALTAVLRDEDVYRLVTDSAAAEEAALDAIEAGDLPLLSNVLTAAPGLQGRPVAWGLTVTVILLAQNEIDKANDLARQVAHQASPLQRRAHTVRLRALRDHHPDLPGLDHVIAIIDPEAAAS